MTYRYNNKPGVIFTIAINSYPSLPYYN